MEVQGLKALGVGITTTQGRLCPAAGGIGVNGMASGLDWSKEERRRKMKKVFTPWSAEQRKKIRKRNHWGGQTWDELRARTQALADAAAPKFDNQGDDGRVPW